jgi:cold shock CspA family protein
MRLNGKLIKWIDDRGFGFIAPVQGDQEIFVHISAFPEDGRRPQLGELLTFEIETTPDGKKRAKAVARPPDANEIRARQRRPAGPREGRKLLLHIATAVILVVLVVYGYGEHSRRFRADAPASHAAPAPEESVVAGEEFSSGFRCDGRTYCSQMTSCAEATYFLKYCPDVRMDGDSDGIPCEEQWCTGPLAR